MKNLTYQTNKNSTNCLKWTRFVWLFVLIQLLVLQTVIAQKLLDPASGGGPISIVTASAGNANTSIATAYSVRQLKTNYDHPATITPPAPVSGFVNSTTPLLRVLRSSDNGQLDIGYDVNGNLDSVVLKNFVTNNGANPTANGFVTVWYDQSGNSKDAYPPTVAARPRIVNAGVIERNSGGQIGFYGINGGMLEHRPTATTTYNGGTGANIYGINGNRTLNVVSQPRTYTDGRAGDGSGTYLIDRYGDPNTANGGTPTGIDNPLTSLKAVAGNWSLQIRLQDGTGIGNSFGGSIAISTSRSDNVTVIRSGSLYALYVNGVLAGSNTLADGASSNPMSPVRIGYGSNTNETVYYGEFVLFPSALSGDDLSVLNVSQTDYFVLGPPPNTWAGTVSDVWTNAANWSNATVPDNLATVTIPSGTTFSPVISSAVTLKRLTITSGATLTNNNTLSLSDNLTVNGTLSGSGTVVFNGGLKQTISGTTSPITFTNLTISNTFDQVVCSTNVNVSGTLTINTNANFVPAPNVVVNDAGAAGTITGTGTAHVTRIASVANYQNQYKFSTNTLTNLTVNYAGLGDQTITLTTNHGNIAISGTGTKTLSAALSATNVTGNVSVLAATLSNGGFAMVGAGTRTLSVSNGARLLLGGTTSAFPTGFSTFTFAANSTVEYAGTGAQTIANASYGNLVSSSTGTRTLGTTINIAGNFTKGTNAYTTTGSTVTYNGTGAQTIASINYNNLAISTARTGSPVITLESGTVGVAGTFSITATGVGSYDVTGNTVSFTGAAQTVPNNFAYNNLTLGGTGAKTTTGITVNGILSIEGNAAVTLSAAPTFGVNATLQFNKTAAFTANLTEWPATFSGTGGVIVRSSAATTLSGTARDIVNELFIETGSILNLGTITTHSTGYLYLGGTLQTAAGTYGGTGSGAANINATFFAAATGRITIDAISVWDGSSNTDWATPANWTPANVPGTGTIVIIPSGPTNQPLITSADANALTLVLENGSTLSFANNRTLTIAGNFENQGGNMSGTAGTVVFSGTNRTITGTNTSFPNLTIGNGASVSMSGNHSCVNFAFGTGSTASSFTHLTNASLIVSGTVTIPQPTASVAKSWNINAGSATVSGLISYTLTNTTNTRIQEIVITSGTLNANGGITFTNITNTGRRIVMSGGAGTLNIGGPLTLGTGQTLTAGTAGSTVNFNGSSTQTIPIGVSQFIYHNLTINNTAGATLSAAVSATNVTGNLTVQTGTLSNGGGAIVGGASRTLTVADGATLTLAGTTSAFPTGFGTITLSPTSTVNYAGTGAQTVVARTYGNLTISGARTTNSVTLASGIITIGGTFTPSATFTSGNYIVTNNTIEFNSNGTQTIPAFNYNNLTSSSFGDRVLANSGTIGIANSFTPGGNAYTVTGSTINYNGTGSQTIAAFNYNNLTSSSSGARVLESVGTIEISGIFTPGTNSYTVTGSTVLFSASSGTQTIPAFTFNNLSFANSGLKNAGGNITVNGVLDLPANQNSTRGHLEMTIAYGSYATGQYPGGGAAPGGLENSTSTLNDLNSHILTMGPSATTTGVGDVTGKIRRSSIVSGTTYTFGNANTRLTFTTGTGTIPTQVTVVATRGTTHADKTNTVQRTYQVLRTGGTTGATMVVRFAYDDTELNGNTEGNLVLWDHHIPYAGATPHEHGKTNQSTTENWVELASHGVTYLATEGDVNFTKYWMISNKVSVDTTWLGAVPGGSWLVSSNWSAGVVPPSNASVVIPDAATTANDPTIDGTVTVGTILIQPGGVLNGGSGTIRLTGGPAVNGGSGTWVNNGTFNTGTSTIIIDNNDATMAGTTVVNNFTVESGKKATIQANAQITISGTIVNNGVLDATANPNTITFTGADRTIPNPNGTVAGYHSLVINGTGTALMPATLNIRGNLTTNQTVDYTTNSTNLVFNGLSAQQFGGSVTSPLHRLTIDNTTGMTLTNNLTVNENLVLTNGNLSISNNSLTLNGAMSGSGSLVGSTLSNLTIGGTGSFGTLRLATNTNLGALTINRTTSGLITLGSNLTVNNAFTLTNGEFVIGSNSVSLNNDFIRTNGTITGGSTSVLALRYTSAMTSPLVFTSGGQSLSELVVNGVGGSYTLGTNLTIENQLSMSNGLLSLNGNNVVLNGNIVGAGGAFVGNSSSNLTINGSGATNSGIGFDASNRNVNNLTINRSSSGSVPLATDVVVNGTIALTAGDLILNGQTLTARGAINRTTGRIDGFTGTLHLNGSSAQTLPASLFVDTLIQNLNINNTAGVTLGGWVKVRGALTPTAGQLNTANMLILESDATGTGRIAAGTGSYITGNVQTRRHIPSLGKLWRFLSSPVQSQKIQNWRNHLYLTGPSGQGFDPQNTSTTVFTYNEPTAGNLNLGWTAATSTSNPISVGRGYRVFVRGSRLQPFQDPVQNEVVLSLTGVVNTGPVTMPVSFTTTSTLANDGWCLVGNPYPSDFDWKAFYNANSANPLIINNIDPSIQIYNPAANGYGTFNANNAYGTGTDGLDDGIIPQGAAFWVKATGASPVLVLQEAYKTNAQANQLHKTEQGSSFRIRLVQDQLNSNELVVVYNQSASVNTDQFDARKLPGSVNISAYGSDSVDHTITVRPLLAQNDTIRLNVTGAAAPYTMQFINSSYIAVKDQVFLVDEFTQKYVNLKTTTSYTFNITSDPNSFGPNRFYIIVASDNSLPVDLIHFNAKATANKQVDINWATAAEVNASTFEVQRSSDNHSFETIKTVQAQGKSSELISYSSIDERPEALNYYRLKMIDNDGSYRYSAVRLVSLVELTTNNNISLYPVPANKQLTIANKNGIELRSITLYNAMGKIVATYSTEKTEMELDIHTLQPGVYIAEITDAIGTVTKQKFVKE